MAKEYGSLTLEQQAKLMQEIDALPRVEGDDGARARAKELIDFLYSLERHGFITPDKRVRYLGGIQDAMERRKKNLKNGASSSTASGPPSPALGKAKEEERK